MLDLMPRTSAEGALGLLGLGRAAILGTSAIFFAAASVAPAAAVEVDELKSEMRQLLDRIDQLEQNQQRTQIEVDQIEANSAWLVNEAPVRARASVINPATTQGEYVSGGDFPGSFKLPGSDSSMSIYGFMKADYSHNFGPLRAFDGILAVPQAVPLRGAGGSTNTGQTNFRFNASQFNVETRSPSEYGEIRTLLQFDWLETNFDGGVNNATVNEIRSGLRLAQASVGPWTFGQQWTAMTDFSQYAETADWDNVQTGLICRCPSLTYADSLGGGWSFGFSIVEPVTQIDLGGPTGVTTTAALVQNNTGMPDFQGNIKYAQDWGHIWLSGQVRRISYIIDDTLDDSAGATWRTTTGKNADDALGWGFNLGLNLSDPVGLHARDRLYLGLTYGEGMRGMLGSTLNYAFSAGAVNLDGVVNPVTGDLDPNTHIGITAHYQHWWTDTVRSTVIYAVLRNQPGNKFDAAGSLRRSTYGIANLFWSPVPRVNLGIEAQYLDYKAKGNGTLDGNNSMAVQATAMILW